MYDNNQQVRGQVATLAADMHWMKRHMAQMHNTLIGVATAAMVYDVTTAAVCTAAPASNSSGPLGTVQGRNSTGGVVPGAMPYRQYSYQ